MDRRPILEFSRIAPSVAGAVAGTVAAVIMAMFASLIAGVEGAGVLTPAVLVAATFLGEQAMTQPVLSSILGVLVHVVVGAGVGAVFAVLTRKVRSPSIFVLAGLTYGTAVFLLVAYLVLPVVNPWMIAAVAVEWFFLYHLAFGAALSVALMVPRWNIRRREAEAGTHA